MSARIEADINPDVLIWARESAGFALEQAAAKAHVQPIQLSSWEVGMSRPTVPQLRTLAQLYKRPLAAFFLPQVPQTDPPIHDFRRLPGGAERPMSPQLRYAIRVARSRRQVALDLSEDLGESPAELRFTATVTDDPERIGGEARIYLRMIGKEPGGHTRATFNRWRAAMESAGVLVLQAQRVPLEDMRGFSLSERPLPVIVANNKDHPLGRTFTLLHEFAHLALGASGVCDINGRAATINDPVEVFCNHVAGAALVPKEHLLELVPPGSVDDSTISSTALHFGVSRETVARRLVKVGRLTDADYRRKRALYISQRKRHETKKATGGPPPAALAVSTAGLLARLASDAYDEGKITASEFSDYLGVNLSHLGRIQEIVRSRVAATGAG